MTRFQNEGNAETGQNAWSTFPCFRPLGAHGNKPVFYVPVREGALKTP